MSDSADELVYANGIDATTGGYLLPAMTLAEIAAVASREPADPDRLGALTKVTNALTTDHLGLPFDVDPVDISQAGWGLVFSADEHPDVKAALAPLLARRTEQVSDAARLKVLEYKTGESRQRWLARYGVAAGNIDPTRVPFYLLIVGCPSKIPFGFCRELAVEYAVGLLSFDTPAEYAAYAASVVAVERNEIKPRSRQVTFFATRHGFDAATQLSADRLVKPLSEGALSGRVRCQFESIWGDAATHEAITEVLVRKDAKAPGFLFTATHGMGFPLGHADQRAQQGSLLCQNWAGPKAGAIERSQYFAGADVPDAANVAGLCAFLFACFGGGTPARDRFAHKPGTPPPPLAEAAFAAALPQQLLATPGRERTRLHRPRRSRVESLDRAGRRRSAADPVRERDRQHSCRQADRTRAEGFQRAIRRVVGVTRRNDRANRRRRQHPRRPARHGLDSTQRRRRLRAVRRSGRAAAARKGRVSR